VKGIDCFFQTHFAKQRAKKLKPSGIALILVLVVLTMLVLLAIPFSASMSSSYRSSRNNLLQTQAKLAAQGALEYSIAQLTRTSDHQERYVEQPALYKTPDYDILTEYEISLDIPGHKTNDPRGQIWSADVQDEQGKVNVNSATPWLLGNLMGSAIVAEQANPSQATIFVDSTALFPPTSGLLWANGELISYERTQSNAFLECRRGMYSDSPRFLEAQTLHPGTLIIPAKAYRICRNRISYTEGKYHPFRTVDEIKRIANYGMHAIEPALMDRLRPFLTVYSLHDIQWVHSQPIRNDLGKSSKDSKEKVLVQDPSIFQPGLTVRIQEQEREVCAMVLQVQQDTIVLDTKVTEEFHKDLAQISILQLHPININSAHPRVIYALLKGIRTSEQNWVDAKQADLLTSSILGLREQGGFLKSIADLGKFLETVQRQMNATGVKDQSNRPGLTNGELAAILASAQCPIVRSRFAGIQIPPALQGYQPIDPLFAPYDYRNWDTYTISAAAVIGNDSAVPLAQARITKIVQVAPNGMQRFRIESQKDFAGYLNRVGGYRVITWPNFPGQPNLYPANDPSFPDTGLSLDTIPMYPAIPEGMKHQQYLPWNETYEGVLCPDGDPGPPQITLEKPTQEIAPGSLSFWFCPTKDRASYVLFLMGREEWQDRMILFYDRGELIFQVCDGTLDQKAAEIWADIPLEADIWYHIRVAWHSTSPGGLDLWVDGMPKGEFCYRNREMRNKSWLAQELGPNSNQVVLNDASGLDIQGVVQIGDEAIEYSNIIGNTLIVRENYPGYSLNEMRRGARGTSAARHPRGACVAEFGYSDALDTRIFPATELAQELPEAGGLFSKLMVPLIESSSSIKANTTHFGTRGVILIAHIDPLTSQLTKEIVRYGNTSSDNFLDCERGKYNTSPHSFPAYDTYIFPLSISVKNASLYEDKGFLQIDQEWIQYESKEIDNVFILSTEIGDELTRRWVQDVQNGKKYATHFRPRAYTYTSQHRYGSKVMPVFRTKIGWLGKYDPITLIHENGKQRESNEVAWALGKYAALKQDVQDTYEPGRGSRILKFPSSELPLESHALAWGKAKGKTSASFVLDEVELLQTRRVPPYRLEKILLESSEDILLQSDQGLPDDSGIIKIGDEYIGYQAIQRRTLIHPQRELGKTRRGASSANIVVYPIFYIPVSSLTKPINKSASVIPLQNYSDFAREGYLYCDQEIIGYSGKMEQGLKMPIDEQSQGTLRGSFGTTSKFHETGRLVYSFPARYWDRCIKFDDPNAAYFAASKTAPGAFWHRIVWNERNPNPRSIATVIRARIEGKPDWSTKPTNQPGGIFEFTDPNAPNLLQASGDTLELRVYFQYKSQAMQDGAWKTKTLLKSVFVEYLQPTRILKAE